LVFQKWQIFGIKKYCPKKLANFLENSDFRQYLSNLAPSGNPQGQGYPVYMSKTGLPGPSEQKMPNHLYKKCQTASKNAKPAKTG